MLCGRSTPVFHNIFYNSYIDPKYFNKKIEIPFTDIIIGQYEEIKQPTMTHVTTVTLKLNLTDEEDNVIADAGIDDMVRLATHLQHLAETLQCDIATNVTEICTESCICGSWTVENERMGYELVTTYHFELKFGVRHVGQYLSNSTISTMVDAIIEESRSSYSSHYVSYPVHWCTTPAPSMLIDASEAVDYYDYERNCAVADLQINVE